MAEMERQVTTEKRVGRERAEHDRVAEEHRKENAWRTAMALVSKSDEANTCWMILQVWRGLVVDIRERLVAELRHTFVLQAYSALLAAKVSRAQLGAICAAWHSLTHERRLEQEIEQLQHMQTTEAEILKEHKEELESELQRAYRHIDGLTDKLKGELNTKEGLVKETSDLLRENRELTRRMGIHDAAEDEEWKHVGCGTLPRDLIVALEADIREVGRVQKVYVHRMYRVFQGNEGCDSELYGSATINKEEFMQGLVEQLERCRQEVFRETFILDAAFDKFISKVAMGCSIRLWFKTSLLVLLIKLNKPEARTVMLAILTSFLHVCVNTYPYAAAILAARAISRKAQRIRLAKICLVYLLPVWGSMVRLLGIRVCDSKVWNFSSFGCVAESDLVSSREFANVTSCQHSNRDSCTITALEFVGLCVVGYVAWNCIARFSPACGHHVESYRSHTLKLLEPLLQSYCSKLPSRSFDNPETQEDVKVPGKKLRVEFRFNQWLWKSATIEFWLVPWFIILGLQGYVGFGTVLIYIMYGFVCWCILEACQDISSSHEEVRRSWHAKWKKKFVVPFIDIELPFPRLLLVLALCIPAFTDNMTLSLAIGSTQTIWHTDYRLQCTWQATWKHIPFLSSLMQCISLPQTLGLLMFFGLYVHISVFVTKIEQNPRAAAEVASLGLLSELHETIVTTLGDSAWHEVIPTTVDGPPGETTSALAPKSTITAALI